MIALRVCAAAGLALVGAPAMADPLKAREIAEQLDGVWSRHDAGTVRPVCDGRAAVIHASPDGAVNFSNEWPEVFHVTFHLSLPPNQGSEEARYLIIAPPDDARAAPSDNPLATPGPPDFLVRMTDKNTLSLSWSLGPGQEKATSIYRRCTK